MARRILDALWLVGGPEVSDPRDCLVYAVDLGELVLIDCGAGPGWPRIKDALLEVGLDPGAVHTLVLTHGHVDHIGAASQVRSESGCRVVAHALDAEAIATGDPERTAASWYGIRLPRTPVDLVVNAPEVPLEFTGGTLRLVHAPGHTPGSLVALVELGGLRVVFAQDVHGPFDAAFGSDLAAWRRSMERLLALAPDVLCEGHYGVYRGAAEVRRFVEGHLAAHRER